MSTVDPTSPLGAHGVHPSVDVWSPDRRSRLDELTRRADDDGLYDLDADAYRDALDEARKP